MKKYTHTLIFLHGFTMSPKDNKYFTDKILRLFPKDMKVRVFHPKAPLRMISCYKRNIYTAWFDYYTKYHYKKECINEELLKNIRKRLHRIIDKAVDYHGDSKKVFVAGYSQGSSMAMDMGITYPKKLGGIIGFKGDIPNVTDEDKYKQSIWACHGKKDDTIGFDVAKESYDKYKKKYKYDLTFLEQKNANHNENSGVLEEMRSLKEWLNKRI